MPGPASSIDSETPEVDAAYRTTIGGRPCLTALANASWATRKNASSTAAGGERRRNVRAGLRHREALDPQDQPIERGPDAQVVEDRQPQVAADGAQPVPRRSGRCPRLRVAGRVQALDEQGQFLESVVVDVGRDARPFRLGRGDDQVALQLGSGREAGEWPDREPTGDQDEADPESKRKDVRARIA